MYQYLLILLFRKSTPLLRGDLARLNDHLIELEPDGLSLDDLLLHSRLCDQSVDINFFLLPDSVGSVHGLEVHLGVPVGVIEDDVVRGHEVDAEATRTGREHEDEVV